MTVLRKKSSKHAYIQLENYSLRYFATCEDPGPDRPPNFHAKDLHAHVFEMGLSSKKSHVNTCKRVLVPNTQAILVFLMREKNSFGGYINVRKNKSVCKIDNRSRTTFPKAQTSIVIWRFV